MAHLADNGPDGSMKGEKRMKKFLTIASASVTLIAQPVMAQNVPSPLQIVIDKNPQSVQCGVNEDSLRAAIRSAMRYNRVAENEDHDTMINLRVIAIPNDDVCNAVINLAIKKSTGGVISDGMSHPIYGTIELCSVSTYILNANKDISTILNDGIKAYFDNCLAQIEYMTNR